RLGDPRPPSRGGEWRSVRWVLSAPPSCASPLPSPAAGRSGGARHRASVPRNGDRRGQEWYRSPRRPAPPFGRSLASRGTPPAFALPRAQLLRRIPSTSSSLLMPLRPSTSSSFARLYSSSFFRLSSPRFGLPVPCVV